MNNFVSLVAADGHQFDAYISSPPSEVKGGLVLLQEIFGVNSHIRDVADRYASHGYLVLAVPTMSRVQKNVDLGYSETDMKDGFALKLAVDALENQAVLLDIQAAINESKKAGKVGIFGYCWGGLLTWRSACLLEGLSVAGCFYGVGIPNEKDLKPTCPVIAHFGTQDSYIPMDSVEGFKLAQPAVETWIYEAHHGFNCDQRASYNEEAAKLSFSRTLDFFETNLTKG